MANTKEVAFGAGANDATDAKRRNSVVQPLLTDLYQITMAYAYWKNKKTEDIAVFDLFYRKNPFHGEFAIFAGLEECLKFIKHFRFSLTDIEYLKSVLPNTVEDDFFAYLLNLDTSKVTVFAIDEGMVVFPKVPLMRLSGPLAVVQLLETTLLTLVNYASLVATNAARFRLTAGADKKLFEFGLRRAQGPDGGLSASRYCYLGGFDGTSNVLAGKLFGIPVIGTHAHSYISSFSSPADLPIVSLKSADGTRTDQDFLSTCRNWLQKVCQLCSIVLSEVNKGEFAAYVAYAIAFPTSFLCLLDTYDVVHSGLPNFCAVALGLNDLGYRARGVRLDSGDLAYLSKVCRETFTKIGETFENVEWFPTLTVVASNDINEDTILSLNQQGHSIDAFGVGTHLVTCQRQPALGCVYKLVALNGEARIKLSEDIEKVSIPGQKLAYRLFGHDGHALVDLMQREGEDPITSGTRVLCRHPFQEKKRAYVSPSQVLLLHRNYFSNGCISQALPSLRELKQRCEESLRHIRDDHKRALNPTPYKVSVSDSLYNFIHDLWLRNMPIGELA